MTLLLWVAHTWGPMSTGRIFQHRMLLASKAAFPEYQHPSLTTALVEVWGGKDQKIEAVHLGFLATSITDTPAVRQRPIDIDKDVSSWYTESSQLKMWFPPP
ncbi:hypothetical protein BXZ70DRAFT_906900 [Cristinia sonorae]|uniref:Uncharacterized protein n=1 Tax=Cristinia sonorae TaxID=1940300 RepID=A0A8K0URX5_9AGAR|nr:hypothetical protein BXZ70DRAFT_906900 [Cristinia sonorae]